MAGRKEQKRDSFFDKLKKEQASPAGALSEAFTRVFPGRTLESGALIAKNYSFTTSIPTGYGDNRTTVPVCYHSVTCITPEWQKHNKDYPLT
jgi:hypothetical protein